MRFLTLGLPDMPAASCLVALPGAGYREAAQTLKARAEAATRRRRERGVA